MIITITQIIKSNTLFLITLYILFILLQGSKRSNAGTKRKDSGKENADKPKKKKAGTKPRGKVINTRWTPSKS